MAKYEKDKYYATPDTEKKLINEVLKYLIIKYQIQELIEPSAGNGKLINALKSFGLPCTFIDTSPEHPEIEKKDFFDWKPSEYKRRAFIGGPPYSGILFPSFLRHCQKNKAELIAFISPISASNDNFFKRDYKLVYSNELGPTIFLSNEGKETTVSVCINIWVREEGYILKKDSLDLKILKDFEIVVSRDPYRFKGFNYCLTMQGYAGRSIHPLNMKKSQDHIGIKLLNKKLIDSFDSYIKKFHETYFRDIAFHSMSNPYMSKKRFISYLKKDFLTIF
jgi:hypothetical protein